MPIFKFTLLLIFLIISACQLNSSRSKAKRTYSSVDYTPPFEPTYTSTGAFMGANLIQLNGEKIGTSKLPIQHLENHFGKSLYFDPIGYGYPKPFGDRLTKEELANWLSTPQVLYGTDKHQNPFESWILPDQNIVTFKQYLNPLHGQVWQRDTDICFRYEKEKVNCGKLYRAGGGFYFTRPGYWGWLYFRSKDLASPQSATGFLSLVKSNDATYAFVDPSSPLVFSNFQTTKGFGAKSPNDIAIIISNSDYNSKASDIPNIDPAQNDGNAIFHYLTRVKGLSPDNIIRLNNATQSQMVNAFGSYRNHKGSAFNWVKPGKSNLYVYYAGHGAPSEDGGLLIPTDAKYDSVELNGYPVGQLLNNLSKIPAKYITVMLESCFSGVSAGGTVVANASPIYIQKPISSVPENINLITAAGPNQIASWQQDKRQSLFTKYLLMGLKGQADNAEYGNEDGHVDQQELQRYLDDTMTYEARRGYGREQSAKVHFTNGFVF